VRALLGLALLAGCSNKVPRIPECDQYAAVFHKLSRCEAISESNRELMKGLFQTVRTQLEKFESGEYKDRNGDIARICKSTHDKLRLDYEKFAPDCFK